MALTSPTFTVNFCLDVEDANFGKLVITDTTDYGAEGIADSDIIGYTKILYPDGTFYIGSFDSPDIDGGTSFVFNTLAIPKDSNGAFMEGSYSFSYFIRVSGAVQPGDYNNEDNAYEFCPCLVPDSNVAPLKGAVADIDVQVDCFCLKIEATDDTDVCTPTTDSRTFTLYPPPSLGLAAYETSSATLTYSFSYSGGYELQVNRLLTYVSGIFTYKVRVKSSVYKNVQCDRDLCALTNCFNQYRTKTLTAAGQYGGFMNLPKTDLDKWIRILNAYIAHDNNLRCGNNTEAATIYDELKSLLSCNCNCSDDDDTPRLINPYCSGAGSNNSITVVAAGTGTTVSAVVVGDTTTYSVSVQQSIIDNIATNTANILTNTNNITNILAGTAGNNYRLLSNNLTQVGTDAATTEKTLMSYTLGAAQLAANGDRLKITARFVITTNSNSKFVRLYFGATATGLYVATGNARNTSITLELQVDRTGASSQLIVDGARQSELPVNVERELDLTGSENLGGTVLIKATGQNGTAAANDIICKRLTVEYFKKA